MAIGSWGFSGRDTNFDVAIEVLHCGLKLGRDLILGVATKLAVWVSRKDFWCRDREMTIME